MLYRQIGKNILSKYFIKRWSFSNSEKEIFCFVWFYLWIYYVCFADIKTDIECLEMIIDLPNNIDIIYEQSHALMVV